MHQSPNATLGGDRIGHAGFGAIAGLTSPEIPEPTQRRQESRRMPLHPDLFEPKWDHDKQCMPMNSEICEQRQHFGAGALPYSFELFEQRLCAELRNLLDAHHSRVELSIAQLAKRDRTEIVSSWPDATPIRFEPNSALAQQAPEAPQPPSPTISRDSRASKDSEAVARDKAKSVENCNIESGTKASYLHRFVHGVPFKTFTALAILSNALIIGVEVQYLSDKKGEGSLPPIFTYLSNVYASIFMVELVLRIIVEKSEFLDVADRYWNLLDVLLVLSASVEVIIRLSSPEPSAQAVDIGNATSLRVVRVFRFLRFMRVLRITRLFRLVNALRTLIFSITTTFRDVFWTVILITMIIYMAAIVFTQAFIDYESTHSHAGLELWWGSLFTSMLTLFEIISGGVSWYETATPLQQVGLQWIILLIVYVFFMCFAVLNVITGIFCNSAIQTAARNPDIVASSLMRTKKELSAKLQKLFYFIDEDNTGTITLQELETLFEHEEMRAYFEAIGLDWRDAWTLFRLIDADSTQTIELDEFVTGVLKLKGEARAIDIALLISDQSRMLRKLTELVQYVQKDLLPMREQQGSLTRAL